MIPRIAETQLKKIAGYFPVVSMNGPRQSRKTTLIKNIGNPSLFSRFMKLCAGRAGQLLNYSSLANDAGVSVNTVRTWISVSVPLIFAYRQRGGKLMAPAGVEVPDVQVFRHQHTDN